MKTIYKLNRTTKIEMKNGENSEHKAEHFHTNLKQLKNRLEDRLKDISYDDRKHRIYIEGNNEFIFEDDHGKVTIHYHSIDRIKADKYI